MAPKFRALMSQLWHSRLWSGFILGRKVSAREKFRKIYRDNYWGNSDSRSGAGSDLGQTAEIRNVLPKLIEDNHIRTMLDIPCGDWHWMRELSLNVDYVGSDIVPEIIERNQSLYGKDRCRFVTLDLTTDQLPCVDLIFSRDVLVHLSFDDVFLALKNIRKSGSKYFLTTTFTERKSNINISTGDWRPLNLEKPPFNFPTPILIINEKCTEGDGSWGDKSLGLWRVADFPVFQD